jgi:predicted MFS family arabinose efflux permease
VAGLPPRRSEIGFVVTLTLGMAVCTFLPYSLGALGPFITDDLKITRTALGSLTTVMYAVGAALSPVAGPLVDRFGGRRSLAVAFATGALGVAVAAAAGRHYGGLVAGAAVFGISVAFGNPATNQLAARVVRAGQHGIVTGVKQSGVQVGAFLAGLVLPRVAEAVGWRAALGGCALLGVAGLILTRCYVPGPATGPGPADEVDGLPPSTLRRPLDRAVNRLAVYALLMGFGVGAVGAHLPLYAVEELGFSRGTAGLTAALMGFVGIGARVGWGRRQDHTTKPVIRSLGTLAVGSVVATGALWAAASLGSGLLWAGSALFGATAVAWNSLGMLSIVRDVDVSMAGRASGRVLLGFYVGFLIGPVSFGWAVDHVGYSAGWAAVTTAFGLASVLTLRWIWDG